PHTEQDMSITYRTIGLSRRGRWAAGLVGLAVLAIGAAAFAPIGFGRSRPASSGPGQAVTPPHVADAGKPAVRRRIVHEGVAVELTIEPLRVPGPGSTEAVLREGDDVVMRFQ